MHAAATSGKWGKAVPKPPPDVIRDPLISTGPLQKLLESEHSAVSAARRSDAGAHACQVCRMAVSVPGAHTCQF